MFRNLKVRRPTDAFGLDNSPNRRLAELRAVFTDLK
jgi:hypothetical protein